MLNDNEGLELLDAMTGGRVAHTPLAAFTAMAVHPQSGRIAGASADRISFWTPELRPVEPPLGPASGRVSSLAFDPRRPRIAAGTESGEVEIWDLETRTRIASTSAGQYVNHLAYTADGSRLAAAVGRHSPVTGGALRILDGAAGRPMLASGSREGIARALALSPDGGRILTGSSLRSVLYDLEAHELGRFSEGTATAFTPDGSRAVIARSNGTLEVWDPRNFELVAKLYGGPTRSLFFSPDGARLYAGTYREILVYSTELFHSRDPRRAPPAK
jgi:WD40 repeat protein